VRVGTTFQPDVSFEFYTNAQPLLTDRTSHSVIGHWHHHVLCLSATLCIAAKLVSEHANRK